MGFCRDIVHKKGVSASKSHRGRHENKRKQSDENFEQKKFLIFFLMIFELRNFEEMSFYIPQNGFPPTLRWCEIFLRSAMKTNKNSCES